MSSISHDPEPRAASSLTDEAGAGVSKKKFAPTESNHVPLPKPKRPPSASRTRPRPELVSGGGSGIFDTSAGGKGGKVGKNRIFPHDGPSSPQPSPRSPSSKSRSPSPIKGGTKESRHSPRVLPALSSRPSSPSAATLRNEDAEGDSIRRKVSFARVESEGRSGASWGPSPALRTAIELAEMIDKEEELMQKYDGEELEKYLLSAGDFRRFPDKAHISPSIAPPHGMTAEEATRRSGWRDFSSFGGVLWADGGSVPIEVKTYTNAPMPHPGSDLAEFLTRICQLDHPNIEKTLGYCFEGRGIVVVITETQQEGEQSLAEIMSTPEALDTPLALTVMKDLLRAFSSLHSEGVVLGDLKPQNIILKPNGMVKIRVWDPFSMQPIDSYMRDPSVDIRYVSPEVCTKQRPELSEAADVYSLAMIIWTIMSKRPPFENATGPSVRSMLAMHRIPKADKERWPAPLAELIDKMLTFDPSDRPEVAEVESDLMEVIISVSSTLDRASREVEVEEEKLEKRRVVTEVFQRNFQKIKDQKHDHTTTSSPRSPRSPMHSEVRIEKLVSIVDDAIILQQTVAEEIEALYKVAEELQQGDATKGVALSAQERHAKQVELDAKKEEILVRYEEDVAHLTTMLEEEKQQQMQKAKDLLQLRHLKRTSRKLKAVRNVTSAMTAMKNATKVSDGDKAGKEKEKEKEREVVSKHHHHKHRSEATLSHSKKKSPLAGKSETRSSHHHSKPPADEEVSPFYLAVQGRSREEEKNTPDRSPVKKKPSRPLPPSPAPTPASLEVMA